MAYAPFGQGYAGGIDWVQFTGVGNSWAVADPENQTGSLVDFMFRRYNPTQGRWVQPDPAGVGAANPSDPQSWNRYAYVGNRPLMNTDPSGLVDLPCDYDLCDPFPIGPPCDVTEDPFCNPGPIFPPGGGPGPGGPGGGPGPSGPGGGPQPRTGGRWPGNITPGLPSISNLPLSLGDLLGL